MLIRAYLELGRLHRPIPIFLLALPAFWSIAIACHLGEHNVVDILFTYVACLLGAVFARSAGCAINDICDRKLDALVERTQTRPLPSKRISVWGACCFALLCGACALGVLLTLNSFSIVLGCISILLIVIYPLCKRFSNYPQVFLGVTFGYGALMGQAILDGYLSASSILLYLASILWVTGYDSIYAIQDLLHDKKAGIKSVAIAQGENLPAFVGYCYSAMVLLLATVGYINHLSLLYYITLALVAMHCVWQVVSTNVYQPSRALVIFNYNVYAGFLVWLGLLVG